MILAVRPKKGGFLRPFGCGWFIREFLAGRSPYGSSPVNPELGAPQADVFYYYKQALRHVMAEDRATRLEEKRARTEKRFISPDNIEKLTEQILKRLPYKTMACRYHSFVTYFSMLQKLGWVEPSGYTEPSAFQDNYPRGQRRKYFRLTAAGEAAGDSAWANPRQTLYP